MTGRRLGLLLALCSAGVGSGAPLVVHRGHLPAPGQVHLEATALPHALSAEALAERARRTAAANRPGPPTRIATPPAVATPGAARARVGPRAAPSTFRVIQDHDLRSVLPAGDTSVIGEPCAVRAGRVVLVVGNWYAARSSDGQTYQWIDPATQFPSVNAGFCCDQSVVYDPARGLFIWELLYSPDATSNTVRIAVATATEMEADTWRYVDVTPAQLGLPTRHWLDYPQLALSRDHLYLTVNLFEITNDTFTNSVVVRIPLDDLATTGAPTIEHFNDDHFTLTPVQGADDVMHFAAHESSGPALHLFAWPDGSPAPTGQQVPVSGYTPAGMRCEGPDGRNWCARSDDRVMTGWRAGGVLGFMWNAAQDAFHPYPYVRVVRVGESNGIIVDEPDLAREDAAYQYPAVAVSSAGHVGGIVALGGGTRYPGAAVLLADDLTAGPGLFETHEVVQGNSGPSSGDWGDFLCARPEAPDGTTWVTTGFALQGGAGTANVHPHVIRMGRERDITCDVDAPCPDDGEPCTSAVCTSGHCTSPPLADDTACTSLDACALAAACTAGVCTTTISRECTDTDPCTLDTCDPDLGCVFPDREGFDGVLCAFEGDLGGPVCNTTVPRRITAGFTRAQQRVTVASGAGAKREQRRQLRRAGRQLSRTLGVARAARVSGLCRKTLLQGIKDARRRVRLLRVALRSHRAGPTPAFAPGS